MIRKLNKIEKNELENKKNANEVLLYLSKIGNMANFLSLHRDQQPEYIKAIYRFINSVEFESAWSRSEFFENLWIAEDAKEFPTLQMKRIYRQDALRFIQSIKNGYDEWSWPSDLVSSEYSIANFHMTELCCDFVTKWEANYFDDDTDFLESVERRFVYYIETLPKNTVIQKEQEQPIKAGKITESTKNRKEENKMKNIFGENYGAINGMAISMMDGQMAIPGEGDKFYTFNSKTKEIADVSDFVIEMDLPAYAMPVAADTIVAGDIVRHNGKFLFVSSVTKAGKITGTKPDAAEEVTIVPIKNALFNQSFVAKVTTMNMLAGTPGVEGEDGKGSFGGINPMMMMLMLKDKDSGSGSSMDKLLPLMMMQQGGLAAGADGQMNPMLMMLLMDKMK